MNQDNDPYYYATITPVCSRCEQELVRGLRTKIYHKNGDEEKVCQDCADSFAEGACWHDEVPYNEHLYSKEEFKGFVKEAIEEGTFYDEKTRKLYNDLHDRLFG
jgi:hypothetical protein